MIKEITRREFAATAGLATMGMVAFGGLAGCSLGFSSGRAVTNEQGDTINLKDAAIGDVIHLGEFSFDTKAVIKENMGDGEMVDVKNSGNFSWRVLDVKDDKALLVSKDIIGYMQYYDFEPEHYGDVFTPITWEESTVRAWLNDSFIKSLPADVRGSIAETELHTSNSSESGRVVSNDTVDKIFLLSLDEFRLYFATAEQGEVSVNIKDDVRESCYWWVRSQSNNWAASAIRLDGSISGSGSPGYFNGVRPAFWITV